MKRILLIALMLFIAVTGCTDTVPEDDPDVWGVEPAQTAQAADETGNTRPCCPVEWDLEVVP